MIKSLCLASLIAPNMYCLAVRVKSLPLCRLFAALWTVAHQAPLSMGSSRQEHWSALPCPPPGDLPNPRKEPTSSALAGIFFTTKPPGKSNKY